MLHQLALMVASGKHPHTIANRTNALRLPIALNSVSDTHLLASSVLQGKENLSLGKPSERRDQSILEIRPLPLDRRFDFPMVGKKPNTTASNKPPNNDIVNSPKTLVEIPFSRVTSRSPMRQPQTARKQRDKKPEHATPSDRRIRFGE